MQYPYSPQVIVYVCISSIVLLYSSALLLGKVGDKYSDTVNNNYSTFCEYFGDNYSDNYLATLQAVVKV